MLYDVLSVVLGFGAGFAVTWKLLESGVSKEEKIEETVRRAKLTEVVETIGKTEVAIDLKERPKTIEELPGYISGKYMLAEVTLLTPDGLPIASNSSTRDDDTAEAPEIIKFAKRLLDSDRVVLAGVENRVMVIEINPEVLLYAKITRDISRPEMERIKAELNTVLEGLI
ncbi:MAG: hypothetical protein NZ879_05210 [Archaeoglobaceae archaeon]|nr:hypothetical protein [Archaeoglobaceae archaeon]MDW8118365.1 hypothetical protein [Archaeoglobaceae archaeon]